MSSSSFVAKWYTRASRVRIVIAKFDGRWKLPGGPYPIPELIALVAGILATLFLLPRTGQPLMTAIVGVVGTVLAVSLMRRMPYSPVSFGTRVHRVLRLYSSPTSVSSSSLTRTAVTTTTVRPKIDILDTVAVTGAGPGHHRGDASPVGSVPAGMGDIFAQPRSAAAELFG